jgi:8-oxo-dGTP diphosphatase
MKYVVGFLFNPDLTQVVLIRKVRPKWQVGKLNGVGGKVEFDETYEAAMVREFREETGMEFTDWKRFCDLNFGDGTVVFFFGISKDFRNASTVTDEQVEIHAVDAMMYEPFMIPNLRWLLQAARSFSYGETAMRFTVAEVR